MEENAVYFLSSIWVYRIPSARMLMNFGVPTGVQQPKIMTWTSNGDIAKDVMSFYC